MVGVWVCVWGGCVCKCEKRKLSLFRVASWVEYQPKNYRDPQKHLCSHHVTVWLEWKMLTGDNEEDYQGPQPNSLKIKPMTREGDF